MAPHRSRSSSLLAMVATLLLALAGLVGVASPAKATTMDNGWRLPAGTSYSPSTNFLANNCGHSGYGTYINDQYGRPLFHIGTDLGVASGITEGEPVYAIGDGTVIQRSIFGWSWEGRNDNVALIIRHEASDGSEFTALYGHIRSSLGEGTTVKAGEQLGVVGYYGVDNAHLHFGVHPGAERIDGKHGSMLCDYWNSGNNGFVDPMPYLNAHPASAEAGSASPFKGVNHIFSGTAAGAVNETYWGAGNALTTDRLAALGEKVTAISTQIAADGVRHVYSGTESGKLYETYWGGNNNGVTTWQIGTIGSPVTSVSSYITGDGVQHVFSGTAAGTIHETYWGGGHSLTTDQLASLGSGVSDISVQLYNNVWHIYSGTDAGMVYETYWGGGNIGVTTWRLAVLPSAAMSVASWITGDGVQHVFSGTAAGTIHETYWGGGHSLTTDQLASVGSGISSISAQNFNGIWHIYSGTNTGSLLETSWGGGHALSTWQIGALNSPVTSIGSYITGDNIQHVFSGTAAGTIHETYWGGGKSLTTDQLASVGSPIGSIFALMT